MGKKKKAFFSLPQIWKAGRPFGVGRVWGLLQLAGHLEMLKILVLGKELASGVGDWTLPVVLLPAGSGVLVSTSVFLLFH